MKHFFKSCLHNCQRQTSMNGFWTFESLVSFPLNYVLLLNPPTAWTCSASTSFVSHASRNSSSWVHVLPNHKRVHVTWSEVSSEWFKSFRLIRPNLNSFRYWIRLNSSTGELKALSSQTKTPSALSFGRMELHIKLSQRKNFLCEAFAAMAIHI